MSSDLLGYSTPALLGAQKLSRAIEAYRANVSPEFTELVRAYGKTWPSMSPELGFSLASQGLDPNDPMVVEMAQTEGLELLPQTTDNRGMFDRAFGLAGQALDAVGGAVGEVAQGIVRTGLTLAEAPVAEVGSALRALAGAASKATSAYSAHDDDNSLWDDLLDTAGLLASPEFYMGGQGVFSNFGSEYERAGHSDAALLFGQFAQDPGATASGLLNPFADEEARESVLGSGLLPGGAINEQGRADRSQIRIGGASADFGDLMLSGFSAATGMAAPGSDAHNLWSGVLQLGFDVAADPFGAGFATASKVSRASRGLGKTEVITGGGRLSPFPKTVVGQTLDEAGEASLSLRRPIEDVVTDYQRGIVQAEHSGVVPAIVEQYVHSKEFDGIASTIGEMLSRGDEGMYDLNQALGGRLSPPELRTLRAASEAGGDRAVRLTIARFIRQTNLGKNGQFPLKGVREPSRWASLLPDSEIGFDLGTGNAAEQVDRALIAAKVDRADRARIFARWADPTIDGQPIFTSGELISPEQRAEALSIVGDAYKLLGAKLDDEIARRVGDVGELSTKKAEKVEARADDLIKMRDELTSIYGRLDNDRSFLHDSLARETQDFRDAVHSSLGEYPSDPLLQAEMAKSIPLPHIREISKELTGGLMNNRLFKSAYEKEMALSDAVLRVWVPAKLIRGAWTVRVVGEEQVRMAAAGFDSIFDNPMSALAWVTGKKGMTPDELIGEIDSVHARALNNVDTEINLLGNDVRPDGARLVATGDWQTVKRNGPLGKPEKGYDFGHRLALTKMHDTPLTRRLAAGHLGEGGANTAAVKDWFFENHFEGWLRSQPKAVVAEARQSAGSSRALSDAYVAFSDSLIGQMTGGNSGLMEFVAKGEFAGLSLKEMRKSKDVGKAFERELRKLHKQGIGPEMVPSPRIVEAGRGSKYNEMTRKLFANFMGIPSNTLSRNTTFRQSYWKRISELAGEMDQPSREKMMEAVRESFPEGTNEFKMLHRELTANRPSGGLTFNQADRVAKSHGLATTQDLLYDQARRGQWSDMLRGVFVFAEAWREIATTWTRLVGQNPNIVHRAQQGIEGARDSGIFYTDTNGQERFAYPGGSWATHALGLPGAKTTGSVEGLNMLSNTMVPGLGPVVQVAASGLLPNTTDYDWFRELFMPFGDSDADTPGGFIDESLPPFLQKLAQAVVPGKINAEQFASVQMDVVRALYMDNPEGYQGEEGAERLNAEARTKARLAFAYRSVAQFFSPTAPSVEFFGQTETSEQFNLVALGQEYRKMLDQTGSDAEATRLFETKFGLDPTYVRQGKTKGIRERAFNEEGADWERDNQSLVSEFPDVIGFFAPQGGDFDFEAYQRAKEQGNRQPLTPEQFIAAANKRKASIAFHRASDILEERGVSGAERDSKLRQIREVLAEEYPGFDDEIVGLGRSAPLKDQIEQIAEAVQNDVIAETSAGEGAVMYLKARDALLAEANARGYVTLTGQNVRDLRLKAMAIGTYLSQQHEGFGLLWERVFSRDIKADDLEVAA